jgi:hypothetical protein
MIGSKQGGIADAVMQAVAASPEDLRSLLLANIVLVGGNCKLPGFLERLLWHNLTFADEIGRRRFDQWLLSITLSASLCLKSTFATE